MSKTPPTRQRVTLAELSGFGWKARFTDGNGIVHVGQGVTQAEAVYDLFRVCPSVLPMEIVEEKPETL